MERLFPEQAKNEFKGYKFAEMAFLIFIIFTIVRSLIHLIAPDGGAGTIATINLDVEGGDAIVTIFALWGSSQLLMAFVYVIVYLRYKNLIPIMYVLIIIEYSMRIIIGLVKPLETTGIAPGAIGNYVIIPMAIIMLVFSLLSPKDQKEIVAAP